MSRITHALDPMQRATIALHHIQSLPGRQPDSSDYPTDAKASEASGAGAAAQSYLHCQASPPAQRGVGANSRACPS